MSFEEDVELRDLVSQTLELNGCLSKIRAQLRANVFLALDEDQKLSKNNTLSSKLSTTEGQLMCGIVHDFLKYFSLDFTLSVFEQETNNNKLERSKVEQILNLNNQQVPVLSQLIEKAQETPKQNAIDINLTELSKVELEQETTENHETSKNPSQSNGNSPENDDTFNGTSSLEEEINTNEKSNELSKNSSSKSSERKSPKQIGDILPSLYNNSKSSRDKSTDGFEIKDDYEEDFMSGSEVEFSLGKVDCPKQLLDDLNEYKKGLKNGKDASSKSITTNGASLEQNSIEESVQSCELNSNDSIS